VFSPGGVPSRGPKSTQIVFYQFLPPAVFPPGAQSRQKTHFG
jgi:hypothetical protein